MSLIYELVLMTVVVWSQDRSLQELAGNNKVYFQMKFNLHKQIILRKARNNPPIPLEICDQYYLTDVQ